MSITDPTSRNGIETRHQRSCATKRNLKRCDCAPTYRARITAEDGQRVYKAFASYEAALAWRCSRVEDRRQGRRQNTSSTTVREAAQTFLAGIENGSIRTRAGHRYKPSVIRGYRRHLDQRVVPAFGPARLSEVTLPALQVWADGLVAEGVSPSTLHNIITATRALYGWALPRGLAQTKPTAGLRLPTGGETRDRIASPAELSRLIATLAPRDQAALGLAGYAGLRLGEVLAMQWSAIDLHTRTLRVERSFCHASHTFVAPKSKAGFRTVPIIERLGFLLEDHRVLTNQANGLLFPGIREPALPVSHNALRDRMATAWKKAGLRRLGLHEARHTFASIAIDAGVNPKALSVYMGHSTIAMTMDLYGHLMPGNEAEAVGLLDTYLARSSGA